MLEAIRLTIITIFAVIGIADLIRWLIEKLIGNAKGQNLFLLLPCKGHEEALEYRIRSAFTRLGCRCSGTNGHILLVDCGMEAEDREIGEQLCRKHPCMELCEEAALGELIKEKLHLQNG